jgi:uncharacterized peroxidase-related enzyme
MTRINPIPPAEAPARAKELLDGVQQTLGVTPNMMKTMANSPAVLDGYLAFNNSLTRGALRAGFREQIALAVAQSNGCDYCLSAHTALGKAAGLSPEETSAARGASGLGGKTDAGLKFAQEIVAHRGRIPDESLAAVRQAGYSEAEISEIIGHVALNIFTNYFNLVAQTEVDFPKVAAAHTS